MLGADVTIADGDPLGSPQMVRFNHLHPPFDNVKMRRAVLAVASQSDFMTAIAGDPKNWWVCPSFFTCGTPMENNAGSQALTGKGHFCTIPRSSIQRRPTPRSLGSYSHTHRQVENLPSIEQCPIEAVDQRSTMIVGNGQVESVSCP